MAGGGADVVAAAICMLAGRRATATTAGPDTSFPPAATTATGVMETGDTAIVGKGIRCAAPLTTQASTNGANAATLNTGPRVIAITRWRKAARSCWTPQTARAVSDLHAKAGSLVCFLRR
ncbi:hypothetical protein MINTM021_10470 [Mycobacterium paraintracellulare]|nr:hypothetical protein MINTM021_10470 [Mycobacterium paraintracellulare]